MELCINGILYYIITGAGDLAGDAFYEIVSRLFGWYFSPGDGWVRALRESTATSELLGRQGRGGGGCSFYRTVLWECEGAEITDVTEDWASR